MCQHLNHISDADHYHKLQNKKKQHLHLLCINYQTITTQIYWVARIETIRNISYLLIHRFSI